MAFAHPNISDAEIAVEGALKDLGIRYLRDTKEAPLKLQGLIGDTSQHRRPDFYLPEYDCYIEVFGGWNDEEYRRKAKQKIAVYHRNKVRFFALFPRDLVRTRSSIQERLEQFKIPIKEEPVAIDKRNNRIWTNDERKELGLGKKNKPKYFQKNGQDTPWVKIIVGVIVGIILLNAFGAPGPAQGSVQASNPAMQVDLSKGICLGDQGCFLERLKYCESASVKSFQVVIDSKTKYGGGSSRIEGYSNGLCTVKMESVYKMVDTSPPGTPGMNNAASGYSVGPIDATCYFNTGSPDKATPWEESPTLNHCD